MAWESVKSHSAWHAVDMHGMCFDTSCHRGCTWHCRGSEDGKAQLFHAVMFGCIPVDAAAWTAASAAASAEPAAAAGAAAAEEVLWLFVPKAITSGRKNKSQAICVQHSYGYATVWMQCLAKAWLVRLVHPLE